MKKNQSLKVTYFMISFIYYSVRDKVTDVEDRLMVPGVKDCGREADGYIIYT